MGGDHLFLNVNKTKELITDVKKKKKVADLLHISASPFREGKTLVKKKSLTFWILNTV